MMKRKLILSGIVFCICCAAAAITMKIYAHKAVSAVPAAEVKESKPAPSAVTDTGSFIKEISPAPHSSNIGVSEPVTIVFSRPMNAASVEKGIKIVGSNGLKAEGTVILSGVSAEFRFRDLLEYKTSYRVVVSGSVSDSAGQKMGQDYSWTFATNDGIAPKIRIKNNGSIILSDITGYDYYGQKVAANSEPAVFAVKNEGNANLVIWSIGFANGEKEQFSLSTPNLPVTILPGMSSDFSIVFHPDSQGKKTAYLRIKSNDAVFGFFNLMVTGNGI